MKNLCSLFIALSICSFSYAQAGLNDVLVGKWIGALEYLDYQDNTSRVSLPTELTVKEAGKKLKLQFAYLEPNGKIVRGKNKVIIGDETIEWGGSDWDIQSVEGEPDEGGWKMVLLTEGEDDDRPATLRQTIIRKKNELTLLKEVRYGPDEPFTFRNTYRFSERIEPPKK